MVVTNSALGTNFSPNMEYSGLITILFVSPQISMKTNTFHEVAHQWFYSLVGNDENQEPWLDEGFSEFAVGLCLDAEGNADDFPFWELKDIAGNGAAGEKVNVPCDEASNYQWVIYDRGAMFLKTLMDAVGREKFLSVLSGYCQKYRYGVATTESFLEILQNDIDVDISNIVAEFIN